MSSHTFTAADYATGLIARLALALKFYHPLVRWMAGRLQMQQELAADALGARFAGGRCSLYLWRFRAWP